MGSGGGRAGPPSRESAIVRLLAMTRQAVFVGVFLSLLAHAMFLAVAGVWRIGGGGGGGSGSGDGANAVEMAVIDETELGALTEANLELATPGIDDPLTSQAPGVDLVDIPGGSGLPDSGELGSVGTGLGGAGAGKGIGVGDGQGGSGGGGAKFFGVEARGSRFAYVVDVSGSMEGSKLATLKRELSVSIDGLAENAQFLVFLFESQFQTLGTRDKWMNADSKNKIWLIQQLAAVTARGGTEPAGAFVAAFGLRPRPDAIYFMTDGLFDAAVAERVAALNKTGRKVPIHCIAFGERGSESLMRKIAEMSGGTYTFIEGPRR